MKKVLFTIFTFALGIFIMYSAISIINNIGTYLLFDFLIVIPFFCFLVYLEFITLKKLIKEFSYSNSNETNNTTIQNEIPTFREVPENILNEMAENYTSLDYNNDLRILRESIQIMKTTKSIETYLSRYELAQIHSLTLEQALIAGITIKDTFPRSTELIDLNQMKLPELIAYNYHKTIEDAGNLKTLEAKKRKFLNLKEMLINYELNLDHLDKYHEVIHQINTQLSNLDEVY